MNTKTSSCKITNPYTMVYPSSSWENTLAGMMKTICRQAGLEPFYPSYASFTTSCSLTVYIVTFGITASVKARLISFFLSIDTLLVYVFKEVSEL
jgi:hypothetical protein